MRHILSNLPERWAAGFSCLLSPPPSTTPNHTPPPPIVDNRLPSPNLT